MSSGLNFILLHPAVGIFLDLLPAVIGGLALGLGGRAPAMGWAVRLAGALLILLSVNSVSIWFVTEVGSIAFVQQFVAVQSIAYILFTIGAMVLFLFAIVRSGKAEQEVHAVASPAATPSTPLRRPDPAGTVEGPGGPSAPGGPPPRP